MAPWLALNCDREGGGVTVTDHETKTMVLVGLTNVLVLLDRLNGRLTHTRPHIPTHTHTHTHTHTPHTHTHKQSRPVASISQGGGSYSGGKWTLSLKGVSFGKNVDLCTIPYGAFGPRGVFGPPRPPPPPGYGPAELSPPTLASVVWLYSSLFIACLRLYNILISSPEIHLCTVYNLCYDVYIHIVVGYVLFLTWRLSFFFLL